MYNVRSKSNHKQLNGSNYMHINTQFWYKRNICAYTYFCVYVCIYTVLIFFRYRSMNETDGSNDSSTFRYLRNLHTILYSCCINLHFHQHSTLASSFFPHLYQHSAFYRLFDDSYSDMFKLISHCFRTTFLWCLLKLNIFSCAYWPPVYLLRKKCLF